MYQLGFSTIGCPDYDVDQIIQIALDTKLHGIELRFVNGTIDILGQEAFTSGVAETRRKFEDAGLTIVAVDSSARLGSLDRDVAAQQIEVARANIALAEALGAAFVRVFGGAAPELTGGDAELDVIAQDLDLVARESRDRGVTTLIEAHDIYSTSDRLADLYERGASDALGILWDTLHTYRFGETPADSWKRIGAHVQHVHLKDASTADRDGFELVLTGEGIVPIADILGVLREADYGGYVHFEWEKGWRRQLAEPEVAFPHFAEYMARV